jgi:hypothetical protein
MENVSCGEPNTAYFSHGGPHNIFRTGRSLWILLILKNELKILAGFRGPYST